eukprot:5674485-Amphidinium_carterae.1
MKHPSQSVSFPIEKGGVSRCVGIGLLHPQPTCTEVFHRCHRPVRQCRQSLRNDGCHVKALQLWHTTTGG